MKKILALILAAIMLFAVVSCGNTNNDGKDNDTNGTSNDTENNTELAYNSPVELLTTIWNSFSDDQKFPVGGGNTYNFDTMVDGAPGEFVALADSDYNANLGYPEADVSKIDGVASMFHMMNVNTFTMSAFHFINADDASAMVEVLKNNIASREWICGFPEKLVIMSAPGNYLIVMWGAGDLIESFVTNTTEAVSGAKVVVDQALHD
ncbi:MAG: hypothetical protein U0M06_03395 [Clostridia bacterium]|nr:hypothetical protein [Clostridia bacterium]